MNINTELCLILNTISFVYTALVSGEAALGTGHRRPCIQTSDVIFICHTETLLLLQINSSHREAGGFFLLKCKERKKKAKTFQFVKV